ncbi:putative glucose-6-phosphate 1-epimerase isoform X2 [Diospyros lotus]|uniref:putative glucose-6-phosphate 1-epimerase isoform X2 n=1 Tax=Diospyros lotus TaxID=55363 RepID=UPI0022587257|nr:putative glucose-6-phosphate 1-epimerase isoform X2 [Diospyros lotus]
MERARAIISKSERKLTEEEVSLQGGQVISWRNGRGEEFLFTSSKEHPWWNPFDWFIPASTVNSKPPKALRGGILICFPQFGETGSIEQHGFARDKIWSIDENPPPLHPRDSLGKSFVNLLLRSSEEDLKCWPHRFELRLRVALSADGKLSLISRVRNIFGEPFTFAFAYHSYLSVSDISDVRVEGLETQYYLDNLCQRELFADQGDAITFESEVDRVYLDSPDVIGVLDHGSRRTFVMKKSGLRDVVVWNPWDKKSRAMKDLKPDEYQKMVCVNPAAVENPITLNVGQEWTGRLELINVASSFFSQTLIP